MNQLVSIIVPVYKVEKYLARCVESLLAQTFNEIEIVLVDDGSPDRCGELCDEYAERYPEKVCVIHKENGGLSDARNAGLKVARGKYVLFVDSDDYILPESCERFLAVAEKTKADIVVGNAVAVREDVEQPIRRSSALEENKVYSPADFLVTELSNGIFWRPSWMNLYRTAFLRENELWFVKNLLHEDEEWTLRAVLAAKRIAYCNIDFYRYIIREGSITQTKNLDRNITDSLRIYKEKLSIYRDLPKSRLRDLLLDDIVRAMLHAYSHFNMNTSEKWRHALDGIQLFKNASTFKTRAKVILFRLSKNGYCKLSKRVNGGGL